MAPTVTPEINGASRCYRVRWGPRGGCAIRVYHHHFRGDASGAERVAQRSFEEVVARGEYNATVAELQMLKERLTLIENEGMLATEAASVAGAVELTLATAKVRMPK